MSVKVVIDGKQSYSLEADENSILFRGEAPEADSGYSYAIYNDKEPSVLESFSRKPVTEKTVNEFFNRSKNQHELASLPQIYQPLPIMNRIKSDLHSEGQIPTIHLWGDQDEIDRLHDNQLEDIKIKLNMNYIGLNDIQNFENVRVDISGRSSSFAPKLSYKLKLDKSHLYGYKKFKLRAFAVDSSYIRENICFSSTKAAGLATVEFSYVRLFINKKPIGLFGMIEDFSDGWLRNEFADGDKQYQPGELYQGDITDLKKRTGLIANLAYYGENLTTYNMKQYSVQAGKNKKKKPQVFEALKDFTKFINQTTKDTSMEEWDQHLDMKSFLRSMAIEDLLGVSDGFMPRFNNYLLYNNPEHPGKMTYISSDFDISLGISLFKLDAMLNGDVTKHPGFDLQPITQHMFSNRDILQAYIAIFQKLTTELLHPSVMMAQIDSIVEMIRVDVEWDQSLERVGQDLTESLSQQLVLDKSLFSPQIKKSKDFHLFDRYPFENAVNGPLTCNDCESVKGFINRKVEAVLSFYGDNEAEL
ncbi:hypothetical protein K501DRAFT_189208 [Backusella circina FSU 941]|nr:hypothetical protein K501DRAFT_189208 [Backusella circina FSU 941]